MSEDRREWEDLLAKLGDIGANVKTPVYVHIEWNEEDEEFAIKDTNAEDQDELVACLSWLLYQFACGGLEYCAEDVE